MGTIVVLFVGVYFTREMAILLREQLNKRLGRPSLVRKTSRVTYLGELFKFVYQLLFRLKVAASLTM